MASAPTAPTRSISAIEARSHLGQILDQASRQPRPVVVHKHGVPKAVILGIQEYIRLAAPEPAIVRVIGERSVQRGTDKLSAKEIDAVIREVRREKRTPNDKRTRKAPAKARS